MGEVGLAVSVGADGKTGSVAVSVGGGWGT
jgi:hypothetical protein